MQYEPSSFQKRLWYLSQTTSAAKYNIYCVYRINGEVDLDNIEKSAINVIQQVSILRSHFIFKDDLHAEIVDGFNFAIDYQDIVDRSSVQSPDQLVNSIVKENIRRPFDLSEVPLVRLQIIKVRRGEYILVCVMHHIISDGMSVRSFINNLLHEYSHISNASEVSLEPDTNFFDYLDNLKKIENEGRQIDYSKHINNWNELTADHKPIDLPFDYDIPVNQEHSGDIVRRTLPALLVQRLKKICAEQGFTLYVYFLSVYALTLYRYSQQNNFFIGMPFNARAMAMHKAIGPFIEMLPMPTTVNVNDSVADFVKNMQKRMFFLFENHSTVHDDMLDIIQPAYTRSRNAIYQTLLVMQTLSFEELKFNNLNLSSLLCHNNFCKLDIELYLVPSNAETGDMEIYCEYKTSLFAEKTISSIIDYFVNTLDAVAANFQSSINKITENVSSELAKSTYKILNNSQRDLDCSRPVTDFLVKNSEITPNKVAVYDVQDDFSCHEYSYTDLVNYSVKIASFIRNRAIKSNDIIAIMLPKSFDMYAVIYATLFAGATYLPIDISWPVGRIEKILSDANAKIFITTQKLRDNISDIKFDLKKIVSISAIRSFIENADPDQASLPMIDPENHQPYVIYTSGTTGVPKGVVNTHKALLNRISWMQHNIDFKAQHKVIQKTPVSFDVSVWEIILPMMFGAAVVIPPENAYRKPLDLIDIVDKFAVTTMHFVPSMLNVFMDYYHNENSTLQHVICSGEELLANTCNQFLDKYPKISLYNYYGPTEACIDVTYWQAKTINSRSKLPIGRPIDNTLIYVLDEKNQPLPCLVKGEIYIGGLNLASKYINNIALTSAKFIEMDIFDSHNVRLYKTGDFGKINSDGELVYLGRIDEQVKINGIRIELGEIENQLNSYPPVVQSAVVIVNNKHAKHIIAYVTLHDSDQKDFEEQSCLMYLQPLLPYYMLPNEIISISSLPLASSGKVNKKFLAKMYQEDNKHQFQTSIQSRPETDEENLIMQACIEILKIDKLNLDDSFFAVGGDSIRAIQVLTYIRKKGYDIKFDYFYKYSSLKLIAQKIVPIDSLAKETQLSSPAAFSQLDVSGLKGIDLAFVEDAYPASRLQQLIYYFSQRDEFSYRAYSTWLLIKNNLDILKLQEAVNAVIIRHPILRTYMYVKDNGDLIQIVNKKQTLDIDCIDLTFLDEQQVNEYYAEWIKEEYTKEFDWTEAPLLRVTVHHLSNNRFFLTVTEPWLDGWSASIIITDILKIYINLQQGDIFQIQPLEINYSNYVAAERFIINSKKHAAFWEWYLHNFNPCLLAEKIACFTKSTSPNALRFSETYDHHVHTKLHKIAASCSVGMKHVLLAVHVIAVKILFGDDKLVFGFMSNARPEVEGSERMAGIFLNALPFAIDVNEHQSWRELIQKIYETEVRILPHRFYPTESIIDDCTSGKKLFDTLFNFTDFHLYRDVTNSTNDIEIESVDGNDQTYFTLTTHFYIGIDNKTIKLNLDSNQSGHNSQWLARIVQIYTNIIDNLIDNFEANISYKLPAILYNGISCPIEQYSSCNSLWAHFYDVVKNSPQSIAIIYKGEKFSYKSIYDMANFISKKMQTRVKQYQSKRILIVADKTPVSIAAILAIFSQGLTYVPVNSNTGINKIKYIIDDSQPDLIITLSGFMQKADACNVSSLLLDQLEFTDMDTSIIDLKSNNYERYQPAVLMYTSGSTGTPKGVLLSMSSIINRFTWMWHHMPFNQTEEVVCSKSPINFIDSLWDMFGGLVSGVKTLIFTSQENVDIGMIIKQIINYKITRITLVPTLINLLVEYCEDNSLLLPSLKYCISSGEVMTTELAHRYKKIACNAQIYNLYGSTEITGDVSYYEVTGQEKSPTIPIGKCIPNNSVTIVGSNGAPMPHGYIGQIHVSGKHVLLGYTSTDMKNKLSHFNTGDLGYINDTDEMVYIGRTDRQIKLRGVRIDPFEIEAYLEKHNLVNRAAVKAQTINNELALVAYLCLSTNIDDSINQNQFRDYLSNYISVELQPEYYQFLKEMPLTTTNKIDYNKLVLEQKASSKSNESLNIELTESQKLLYKLWQEVLSISDIADYKNFFELGGNSLKAMRLLMRVNKSFGVSITLADIYNASNLIDMDLLIANKMAEAVKLTLQENSEIAESIQ